MEIISEDLHFGCVDFFESVHLGNHEAFMQNLIVVSAGSFAWDDILSRMQDGRLLGSNLT